jgi:UDP-N-acetylglucosamine 2-epimerase (non-hydrolysing)/GDP/UDP-N,N'-diacetylbacillosamine 2-epimerase (hydrolysing)
MAAIADRSGLDLSVIATGMHLSPQHGRTVEEIRADGFEVSETVHMLLDGDSELSMAKSLGIGVSGLAEALDNIDPYITLVLGDRDEALAAGIAAAHMNIPVAHVHGGDSMDGAIIDDSIRHALTKFAHIHFPVSEQSADRIERLGEEPWRITTVGAPGIDDILRGEYDDPTEVLEKHGFDPSEPVALVIQHPITTAVEEAGEQMDATLDALHRTDLQVLLVYPNSDAGGKQMISRIERHPISEDIVAVENLPRREYLAVMAGADVMVGNSSSGIIEAPSFDLPVVDIGPRQQGRQRAKNTISVPHESDAITEAIARCLTDESVKRQAAASPNPYDYGGAGESIVDELATIELDGRLLRKQLTY